MEDSENEAGENEAGEHEAGENEANADQWIPSCTHFLLNRYEPCPQIQY